MGVSVAEYLGQRADIDNYVIQPAEQGAMCPFMNAPCSKIQQGYEPVCSVRKRTGELWITCRNRLCATLKTVSLSSHQIDILTKIARVVYGTDQVSPSDIYVKREEPLKASSKANYNADYIMVRRGDTKKLVVEMQGGGETSGTGLITEQVLKWRNCENRSNRMLREEVQKAGTIETNAWRRQQEQFIVKGNVAQMSGGAIVFVVGAPIYDYLRSKLDWTQFKDLRDYTWSLAIIGIAEDKENKPVPGPIPLKVDESRVLFTNYGNFLQALTNQGYPTPGAFSGEFTALDGTTVQIP
ncbi:restriction endonuclease [Brevibacillus borstelensis]|uniref:restriction endonuclease n=1 Tax=Brevibacillus borstelensis TaxID=45462 RepID=UPI001562612D|nr:restriction endonuclease [Brevibacillus borstelensis]MBE5395206.1 restriction endonuclease [Brevibacillus borstelensis]